MLLQDLLYLLVAAFVVGMSAAALPPILRALPFVDTWVMRGIRPWACDLCMSFWSTLITTCFWKAMGVPWLAGLPAFVVTFAIVRLNGEHFGPTPDMAELVDSDAVSVESATHAAGAELT